MNAPGVYPDAPMADYLAIPALSAGVINDTINDCPYRGWFGSWLNPNRTQENTSASDAGTIAHEILLCGSESCVQVIDPREYPAKTTGAIPEGWTNAAIRAARDAARAAGRVPVLAPQMSEIRAMVASAQGFIASLRDTEPAIWRAFQPSGGLSEVTIVWQEGATLARARPDLLSADTRLIVDVKTTQTSAEPSAWSRLLWRMGYHLSAAWYARGVRATCGVEGCQYVWLAIEQTAPYLCSLHAVDPAGLALAESQVEAGLRLWERCAARNEWPAYANRVHWVEPPVYEVAEWEQRQASGDWRALFPDLAESLN